MKLKLEKHALQKDFFFFFLQVLLFQSGQEVEAIAPGLIDFKIHFCVEMKETSTFILDPI